MASPPRSASAHPSSCPCLLSLSVFGLLHSLTLLHYSTLYVKQICSALLFSAFPLSLGLIREILVSFRLVLLCTGESSLHSAPDAARYSWVCPVSHFFSKASSSPPLSPQPCTGTPVYPTSSSLSSSLSSSSSSSHSSSFSSSSFSSSFSLN